MGNFNRDNRSGGGDRGGNRFGGPKRSFGGGGFGGGNRGGSDRPQMHSATCSECGQACEVPFRPTGERPVFCNDCFRKQRNDGPAKFGGHDRGGDRFARPRFDKPAAPAGVNFGQFKEQLDTINSKLDRILRALPAQLSAEVAEMAAEETVAEPKLGILSGKGNKAKAKKSAGKKKK